MSDFKQRLQDEHTLLQIKCEALNMFIHKNSTFKSLELTDQVLLIQQHTHMVAYLQVLNVRIWKYV